MNEQDKKHLHDHHDKHTHCECNHNHEDHKHEQKSSHDSQECACSGCSCKSHDHSTAVDSSDSPPGEEEPERHEEHKAVCSACEDLHRHTHKHSHDHHHHHDHDHHHWEKPDNIFLKWIWYFLYALGLVGEHDHDDHGHVGHDDHEHLFYVRNWIMIVSTILGIFSLIAMLTLIFTDVAFFESRWTQLTVGVIAFIIMGFAFLKGSTLSLMKKSIAEDTLVAIATTSAFTYSLFAFIYNASSDAALPYFFYETVEVLWLIYLGRFIEERLMDKITKEMASLESLKPKLAIVVREGKEIEIDINEVVIGDTVVVKAGSVIPVDGIVIEGETTVDESSLTGESLPITKKIDSNVFGGTISANGLIKIKVTKLIGDSFISKILESVTDAIDTKPASQRLADKIAAWLVPVVMAIAFITFILTGIIATQVGVPNIFENKIMGPGFTAQEYGWMYAFYITITIMIIACPCSFALQTPMSVLVASSNAKKNSVIFSSKTIFENIKDIDLIAFDKTGTLTEGKFKVIESNIPEEYLSKLVTIEKTSTHPLAKSICEYYSDVKTTKIAVKEVIGKGMMTKGLMVGSLKWLKEFHKDYEDSEEIINQRKTGSAIIYLFDNEKVIGNIVMKDEIKDSSRLAISNIRKMGIDVVMITGDQRDTALSIAGELGIKPENVFSEVNPDEKSDIIKELQEKGNKVSFVGDGINDSVALIQSNLGIAMGEGSDAAIEAADIVLNEADLTLVAYAIWLSNRTVSTIKRGFGIAIGYNALMVPLAATGILGLTGFGPALAALSMIFNDSIAMLNAMTLTTESKDKFKRKHDK